MKYPVMAPEGTMVAQGKTKEIRAGKGVGIGEITSLDDITAGNGKRHDTIPGKGEWVTTITSNIFQYLKDREVRVAYIGRTGSRTFLAPLCQMVKLEVVIVRVPVAESSFIKRNPDTIPNTRLRNPIVQYHLKTKDKVWIGKDGLDHVLPEDDPFLVPDFILDGFWVHHPKRPVEEKNRLFFVPFGEVGLKGSDLMPLENMAVRVFLLLEEAWYRVAKGTLKDLKVEFGWWGDGMRDPPYKLYVADEISPDNWRLEIGGVEKSKEPYRPPTNASVAHMKEIYEQIAAYSEKIRYLNKN